MKSYEDILSQIALIKTGPPGGARDITWLTQSNVIGVARDEGGRLEIFLAGTKLRVTSTLVRKAIDFHDWHRTIDQRLTATRLLLPPYGHFDPVGAFICAELLRTGADQNLQYAFETTEPIIEISIQRLQLSANALLGLAGELLLLNSLVRLADDPLVNEVIVAWDGWRRSARDFRWRSTGVEVKTTTMPTSTHSIQGVHQVEPSPAGGDHIENRLLLVSIGLQESESTSNSFSIPGIVNQIVERLHATGNGGLVEQFLGSVATYGSESGFGYKHLTMSADAPFTTSFTTTFFRGYDMEDPLIQVLRSVDVLPHVHVERQSVSFTASFPAAVSPVNPIVGANQVAESILG